MKTEKNFAPQGLFRNRHIQTIYPALFKKQPTYRYLIERFTLHDGDFLELYWYASHSDGKPLAVLFHGLGGSYASPYIQGMMQSLYKEGINSVVMHYRGSSGVPNDTPLSYHSGKTDDALEVLQSLKIRYPHSPLFGIGFSLGANLLLKLLGETKASSPLSAAAAISSPFDLKLCALRLDQGFSKFYRAYLLKDLKKMLHEKFERFDMTPYTTLKKDQIDSLKNFYEFDAAYTAPVHGFASAEEYYKKASSKQFLKHITCPTLLIHAKDDPFIPQEALPSAQELSSSIIYELHEFGGHVGFIDGTLFQPRYYTETRVPAFFENFKNYSEL